MKKWKFDRIISLATLGTSLVALVLVLKRPAPVAASQTPAQGLGDAQSFQEKVSLLEKAPGEAETARASTTGTPVAVPAEAAPASAQQVRITSDEVSAAITQAAGALPAAGA